MTCPKCNGLLVPETVHDGALSEDLLRCVNCGRIGEAMARTTTDTTAQPEAPRRCAHCKALAIPGQVLCEPHRTKWRAYMTHRKLRLDVQTRGLKVVLAEVSAQLLRIETKRNYLLKNRKALGG